MGRQAAAVIGAIRRRQVQHQVLDAVLHQPLRGLARQEGRRRGPLVALLQPAGRVRQRADHERLRRRPRMPGGGLGEGLRRHQQVAGRGRRVAVVPGCRGRPRMQGDDEGQREPAAQALRDGDALVGHVADALGVGAVAVRGERQQLAIAAAARAGIADKAGGTKRQGAGRRGVEAGWLRAAEIQRDRDREGFPEVDAQPPARQLESHRRHRAIICSRWNPTGPRGSQVPGRPRGAFYRCWFAPGSWSA